MSPSNKIFGEGHQRVAGRLLLEGSHQLDSSAGIELLDHRAQSQRLEGKSPSRVGESEARDGVDQALQALLVCGGLTGKRPSESSVEEFDED